MARNVVLVGFSGAGKTTIGRELALRLGLEFVDLDDAIEEKYHATIPHIFQKYGESVFRQCEYQTLNEMLNKDGVVIATGGGAPAYKDAMQKIKANAFTVFINLTEEQLFNRLKNSKKNRPLTAALSESELRDYVHRTLQNRIPFYSMADMQVDEDKINLETMAISISEYIH